MPSLGSSIKYLPTLARPMIIITGLSSIKIQPEGAVTAALASVALRGGPGQRGYAALGFAVPFT